MPSSFAERHSATKYLEIFGYSYSLKWGWSKIHTSEMGSYRRVAVLEVDNHRYRPWNITYYNRSLED